MKKIKRILAGILGVLLLLTPIVLLDSMIGEPFSKFNAAHRAEAYAESLYPGQDFYVTGVVSSRPFSFRAEVQSHTSRDTRFGVTTTFYLHTSDGTEEGAGDHELLVESGWNTLFRMSGEAAELAEAVIRLKLPELELIPLYGVDQNRVFVELCYAEDIKPTARAEPYRELIEIDAQFDPSLLKKIPAHFSAVVKWDGKPTDAEAAMVLAQIKAVLEENGLPMSHYSLTLADGSDDPDVSTGVVPAEKIG